MTTKVKPPIEYSIVACDFTLIARSTTSWHKSEQNVVPPL
jgi:hypothetical protein